MKLWPQSPVEEEATKRGTHNFQATTVDLQALPAPTLRCGPHRREAHALFAII